MGPLGLIRWKQGTGVVVGDEDLRVTVCASTLGGLKVLRSHSVRIGEGGVRSALTDALAAVRIKGTVVAGLDARQVYYATSPARVDLAEADAAELLPAGLAAGGKYVYHDLVVKHRRRAYQTVAACARTLARSVMAGFRELNPSRVFLEPAPLAIHAAACKRGKTPRRWRGAIRVLIDGKTGLAFLENRERPFAWRPFRVNADDTAQSVAMAVRGLRAYGRSELDLADIDGVLVHAEDLAPEFAEACEVQCGIATREQPFVPIDDESVATHLARAAAGSRVGVPDLLARLKPPPSIRQIFPWGAALLLLAAVVGGGHALSSEADGIEQRTRMAKRATAIDAKRAHIKIAELGKRHGELTLQLRLLHGFIVKRVTWARIMAEVPARIPGSVVLAGLRGRDSFTMPSNTKSGVHKLETKELSLQGQGHLESGKAAPEDVNALMESLAASEVITKYFPRVDGANVMRKPGRDFDMVTFVAKCSKPRW